MTVIARMVLHSDKADASGSGSYMALLVPTFVRRVRVLRDVDYEVVA